MIMTNMYADQDFAGGNLALSAEAAGKATKHMFAALSQARLKISLSISCSERVYIHIYILCS